MKERLEWVDIAKGISMLCIIAGHLGSKSVDRIVFTFHVPIFFLISGYFISRKDSFKEYSLKRIRGLVVPYLFTSFLLMIAKIPFGMMKGRGLQIFTDMGEVFVQALYGSGSNSNKTFFDISQIGAIWFLLALLWALLLVKFFMDKKYGGIVIAGIAIAAYVSSNYFWLPWSLQSGATAAVFVYIGAYLKEKDFKLKRNWWLLFVGIIVLLLEVVFKVKVSIASNYYKYTIVSVVGAVLISYAILCFSQMLQHCIPIKKVLCFFGNNSMIILCFHLLELRNIPWNSVCFFLSDVSKAVQLLAYFVCKLVFVTVCTFFVLKIDFLRKIFNK